MNKPNNLHKGMAILISGSTVFFGFLVASILVFQVIYSNRVYPGLSISGVDISGLSDRELEPFIRNTFDYADEGEVTLIDGDNTWTFSPNDFGLFVNTLGSSKFALQIGREGSLFNRLSAQFTLWQNGMDIPIMLVFDEPSAQQTLTIIENALNQPAVEATLSFDGTTVLSTQGQVGRIVDIPSLLILFQEHFNLISDATFEIPIVESLPLVIDASQEKILLEALLAQPLTLKIESPVEGDPGPWEITPEALAPMINNQTVLADDQYKIEFRIDPSSLIEVLTPISPGLVKQAKDAKYSFNDDTELLEVIQPAVIGRELLIIESIQSINQKILLGEQNINLVFNLTLPELTDDLTGEDLGITELVSSQTTYFYGSSTGRIQNIQTSAAEFHGLMIAPGATFSMVEQLGDISLDTGYAEALIIYGNRTIKGVGGGVCQVSTTLFRTVFFGGFPVEKRYSHSYRVYYYELARYGGVNPKMAGLDATVYTPLVDFQFVNDTPYWLLMETYVYPGNKSITWKFYSTSDGRSVDWETTGLKNLVDSPEPIYEENPDLEKGEIDQVDWAVKGADVTVSRTVNIDGTVYFADSFTTHYSPWGDVFQYGPGTEDIPEKND
jgi:vancomycin resistance protein YoaR